MGPVHSPCSRVDFILQQVTLLPGLSQSTHRHPPEERTRKHLTSPARFLRSVLRRSQKSPQPYGTLPEKMKTGAGSLLSPLVQTIPRRELLARD